MKRPHSDPGPPLLFPGSPPGPKMAPAPPQPRGQPAPFDPPPPRWRTHLQPLGRAPGLACAASPPPPRSARSRLLPAPLLLHWPEPPPLLPSQPMERERKAVGAWPALLTRAGPPTSSHLRSSEGLRPLAVSSAGAAVEKEEEDGRSRRRSSRRGPGRGPERCGSDLGPDP